MELEEYQRKNKRDPLPKRVWFRVRQAVGLREVIAGTIGIGLGAIMVFGLHARFTAADRYLIPRNAADWSAWGTWLGGVATAGALLYAANQFRLDRQRHEREVSDRDNLIIENTRSLSTRISPLGSKCIDWNSGFRISIENRGESPYANLSLKIANQGDKVESIKHGPPEPTFGNPPEMDDDERMETISEWRKSLSPRRFQSFPNHDDESTDIFLKAIQPHTQIEVEILTQKYEWWNEDEKKSQKQDDFFLSFQDQSGNILCRNIITNESVRIPR